MRFTHTLLNILFKLTKLGQKTKFVFLRRKFVIYCDIHSTLRRSTLTDLMLSPSRSPRGAERDEKLCPQLLWLQAVCRAL